MAKPFATGRLHEDNCGCEGMKTYQSFDVAPSEHLRKEIIVGWQHLVYSLVCFASFGRTLIEPTILANPIIVVHFSEHPPPGCFFDVWLVQFLTPVFNNRHFSKEEFIWHMLRDI